jgi:hypothetical protein
MSQINVKAGLCRDPFADFGNVMHVVTLWSRKRHSHNIVSPKDPQSLSNIGPWVRIPMNYAIILFDLSKMPNGSLVGRNIIFMQVRGY